MISKFLYSDPGKKSRIRPGFETLPGVVEHQLAVTAKALLQVQDLDVIKYYIPVLWIQIRSVLLFSTGERSIFFGALDPYPDPRFSKLVGFGFWSGEKFRSDGPNYRHNYWGYNNFSKIMKTFFKMSLCRYLVTYKVL